MLVKRSPGKDSDSDMGSTFTDTMTFYIRVTLQKHRHTGIIETQQNLFWETSTYVISDHLRRCYVLVIGPIAMPQVC